MPSPDGEIEVFIRIGDDLTASDLLDPEFMQDAWARCRSKMVFFGVPTRTCMAMASHPDPVARLAAVRFEEPEHGELRLSPCVFAFDGKNALLPMVPQGL